jgi:hypothetical protein
MSTFVDSIIISQNIVSFVSFHSYLYVTNNNKIGNKEI